MELGVFVGARCKGSVRFFFFNFEVFRGRTPFGGGWLRCSACARCFVFAFLVHCMSRAFRTFRPWALLVALE